MVGPTSRTLQEIVRAFENKLLSVYEETSIETSFPDLAEKVKEATLDDGKVTTQYELDNNEDHIPE